MLPVTKGFNDVISLTLNIIHKIISVCFLTVLMKLFIFVMILKCRTNSIQNARVCLERLSDLFGATGDQRSKILTRGVTGCHRLASWKHFESFQNK